MHPLRIISLFAPQKTTSPTSPFSGTDGFQWFSWEVAWYVQSLLCAMHPGHQSPRPTQLRHPKQGKINVGKQPEEQCTGTGQWSRKYVCYLECHFNIQMWKCGKTFIKNGSLAKPLHCRACSTHPKQKKTKYEKCLMSAFCKTGRLMMKKLHWWR